MRFFFPSFANMANPADGIVTGPAVKENLQNVLLRSAFVCALLLAQGVAAQRLPLDRIKLPPGFEITVFASDVRDARSLALGGKDLLFVGTRGRGSVYAIRYEGAKATEVSTFASGLNMPNGVAVKDGALYVAEVSRILRFDGVEKLLAARGGPAPKGVVVVDRYPRETHHGWKFIRFGPDGWLYVPVGAPCNICEPDPERYALISRIKPDGSGYQAYARGVRNSVGFDWDPRTQQLWFTDNGRDMLGDDLPSDELNHAPAPGMHFGYPYCHQGDTADPDFGRKRECSEFAPPTVRLGPHVAALGMRFYTGDRFPPEYHNNIFVAEHGSWNRSKKIGYRIARVVVAGSRAVKHEVFAEGWLQGESAWGRPVDLEVMPDGSLLVSDDHAGAIYRIAYRGR
jgi:glucose/arabinose dehydrogenase